MTLSEIRKAVAAGVAGVTAASGALVAEHLVSGTLAHWIVGVAAAAGVGVAVFSATYAAPRNQPRRPLPYPHAGRR